MICTVIVSFSEITVNEYNKTLDEIETVLYNTIEVMRMNKLWESAVITEISVAVYVAPNTGRHIHKNRPFHGFVLNDSEVVRDYCFESGYVMRTEGNSLFYLPKGSSRRTNPKRRLLCEPKGTACFICRQVLLIM